MTVNLSALAGAGQQFFDNNGNPLSGGKLYSYASGTTTPQATYTSVSGATAHTNPIILDSAGRVATGEIWVTAGQNYKFVLKTSAEVTLVTWDNITGISGTGIATNANNVEYDPPFAGALTSGYTVQDKLAQTVSVKDFGAVGDGVTDDTIAFQNALNTGKTVLIPDNTTVKLTSTVFMAAATSVVGASNQTSKILLSGAAWTTAGGNQVAIAIGCTSVGAAANPWYGRINNVQFVTDAASKFNRAICDFASKRAEITDCVFDFTLGLGWTSPHAGGSMGPFTSSINPAWANGFSITDFGSCVFERNTAICSANRISSEGYGFVGYSQATIEDNIITGIGDDPIAIHGVNNVTVSGNYCTSTDGRMYIDSCVNVAVTDNTFERCLGADGRWWSLGASMLRSNGEWALNPQAVPNVNINIRGNRFIVPATADSLGAFCALVSWMTLDGVQSGLTVVDNIFKNDSPAVTTSVPCISVVPVVQAGWTGPAGNPDFSTGGILRVRDVLIRGNRATGSVQTGGVSMASTAANYLGPNIIESNVFDRFQPVGNTSSHLTQTNQSATGDVLTYQSVSPVVLYRNPTVDFSFTALTDAFTSGSPQSLILSGNGSYVADIAGRICGAVYLANATGTAGSSVFLRILKNGVQIGSDLSGLTNLKRRLFSYNNVVGMTFAAGDEITVQAYCSAGQLVSLNGQIKLQLMYN